MPKRYIGKKITVSIVPGIQYDGSGKPAGKMDAFAVINFVK